ncbi:MAG: porin [Burkholderiaceae bacterium]
MKKSLLALAVLTTVTGAANAQSSVTLYGKVDLGAVLDSGGPNGKSVRIDSGVTGGSRIGFKGVEDLGGGVKAAFQLETGYCADSNAGAANFCTGGNNFMGRQAHGDLTGAFGAVSAGRQYSLGYSNLTTIDPFGTGFAGRADNIIDQSGLRLNNSFQYTTPDFAGFTASGEISFGEQTGNWKANREVGGALTYAAGPAYASFTFYDVDNFNGQGTARRNYLFGGAYDFGVVKVHALAQKSNGDPTGLASIDVLDLLGGVTVPLGGGDLMASYIHHNDRTSTNLDAGQYAVGYIYPLSKRTSVYTSFAKINNDNGATFRVGNATADGTGDKSFNFGFVHNF